MCTFDYHTFFSFQLQSNVNQKEIKPIIKVSALSDLKDELFEDIGTTPLSKDASTQHSIPDFCCILSFWHIQNFIVNLDSMPLNLVQQNWFLPMLLKTRHKVASCPPKIRYSNFQSIFVSFNTNTIPLLMHQMHISTIQVSSVMLRPKKLEIRKKNCENSKEPGKTKAKYSEIEPNLSKDRAMHVGDNPSVWDEFIKFTFFLTVYFIFVILSKYLSTSLLGCRDPRGLTVHQQRQSYHFITAVQRINAI